MPPRYNRPARIQVDYNTAKKTINEVTGNYNIWYNRYTGGDNYKYKPLTRAEYRCDIERDSGLTKADNNPNSSFFCIHFAHGCCSKGKDCTFLHRVPDEYDREETTKDCFGRDKFFEERQDMGGVGTFSRENKTLYVGHISTSPDREEIVRKHFEKFGDIEYIKILKDKAVAFVQYKLRSVAEFVKEAMYGQSLDGDEVLNVRWATEDPNPKVKQELQKKAEEQVYSAVAANLPVIGEYGTILDYEYGYQTMPDMYGNDQNQYTQSESLVTQDPQYSEYYNNYYSSQYGVNPEVFQNNLQYYQYQYEGYENQPVYNKPITETVNNTNQIAEDNTKEKDKTQEKKGILSSNSIKNIAKLLNKNGTKKRPPPPPPPKTSSDSSLTKETKKIKNKTPPPPPPPKTSSDSSLTKETKKIKNKTPPPPPPPKSPSSDTSNKKYKESSQLESKNENKEEINNKRKNSENEILEGEIDNKKLKISKD